MTTTSPVTITADTLIEEYEAYRDTHDTIFLHELTPRQRAGFLIARAIHAFSDTPILNAHETAREAYHNCTDRDRLPYWTEVRFLIRYAIDSEEMA